MLFHLLSSQKTIFSNGCDIQMHLRHSTGSTECLLLVITACDHYLAIRQHLRLLTETVIVMRLSLYDHQVFRKFTCKVLGVLKLACGDTSVSNDFVLVDAIVLLPLLNYLICLSDMPILVTFLKVL
ncbi:hypothetical protein ACRRTK_024986 [Alexandromys fortis]